MMSEDEEAPLNALIKYFSYINSFETDEKLEKLFAKRLHSECEKGPLDLVEVLTYALPKEDVTRLKEYWTETNSIEKNDRRYVFSESFLENVNET